MNNRNVLLLCFVCFFNAVNLQAMDSEEQWEIGSTESCAVRFDDYSTAEASLSLPVAFVDCNPSEYQQTSCSASSSKSDCCVDAVLEKKVPKKARTPRNLSKRALIKGFICPWRDLCGCTQFFLKRDALDAHIREVRHVSFKDRQAHQLTCPYEGCGNKIYDYLHRLIDHLYGIEHLNYRAYVCPNCFQEFVQLGHCTKHMMSCQKDSI